MWRTDLNDDVGPQNAPSHGHCKPPAFSWHCVNPLLVCMISGLALATVGAPVARLLL